MKNHQRRTFVHRMLVAAAAALGMPGAFAAGTLPGRPAMRRVRGDVRVNGIAATEGTLIGPGDTVTTGADAEAVYVIGKDAFLQRANSTVRFGDSTAAEFLRVVTGALLAVFGRGEKRLAAPYTTIGIRGTGCYIETGTQSTFFCLCYGKAELRTDGGQTMTYESSHHDRPMMISPTSATRVAPPVENHSDDELVMLEAYVGRKPPFYGKTGTGY